MYIPIFGNSRPDPKILSCPSYDPSPMNIGWTPAIFLTDNLSLRITLLPNIKRSHTLYRNGCTMIQLYFDRFDPVRYWL